MKCKSILFASALALATFGVGPGSTTELFAQTFKVLHNFGALTDGSQPVSDLIMDSSGNLYGETAAGGAFPSCYPTGCGTVYELSPRNDGTWSETQLHIFNGTDGGGGSFGTLVNSHGNLFGAAQGGGSDGAGLIFELTPTGGGWNYSILYSLTYDSTGTVPYGVLSHDGDLFVTASFGGGSGSAGTVLALAPTGLRSWSGTLIHNFNTLPGDGACPQGLVFDINGNAYGTTLYGGAYGAGSIYELTRNPMTGQWTETILHSFPDNADDGSYPHSTLVLDAAGNLYSTNSSGGPNGSGTVFELTPNGDGTWSEHILHSFSQEDSPEAGVTFDQNGNLYGVTYQPSYVYKLTPSGNGEWTYSVVYQLHGSDGEDVFANLLLDDTGNIYGAAAGGGLFGQGTVFEIIP